MYINDEISIAARAGNTLRYPCCVFSLIAYADCICIIAGSISYMKAWTNCSMQNPLKLMILNFVLTAGQCDNLSYSSFKLLLHSQLII